MVNPMRYECTVPQADNDTLLLHETLFHNANGYIGVRSCLEEGVPDAYTSIRGAYINGFYDFAEMKQAEKLYGLVEEKQTILNVADPQGISLTVGQEPFGLFCGTVLEHSRTLDMEAGVTERRVRWRSKEGHELLVEIKRMTSFVRLPLFLMEYKVTSLSYNGPVALASTHVGEVSNYTNPDDPRVAADSFNHLCPRSAVLAEDASIVTTATSKSGLLVATAVANRLDCPAEESLELEGHGAVYNAKFSLKAGESVTLVKYCVFADSLRDADCTAQAEKTLKDTLAQPVETLYSEQRDYLRGYWDNALLEIDGDEALSQAARFNLYQLIASVGKDAFGNIAAKGLSGEGYEGHYFWDTEMYLQPFFTLTNPDITKGLISYRYRILEQARENAKILGHKSGALYPWRTIMGLECSGYFPSGAAQYHINSDIAYSIVSYYLATGDLDLLAEQGAEILFETARLWLDVGAFQGENFYIHAVTGPDEYTCMVNNNYYTNLCAQYNLRWALRAYQLLEEANRLDCARKIGLRPEELSDFARAARCMYLPYDKALDINPQDDSFLTKKRWDIPATPKENFPLLLHYHPMHLYRYQVCKQADTVLAHFILEDAQPEHTIRSSFAYYEEITTHDSSLSTCIFSIVASRLGLREKAYAYFGDSAKLDLFNTHHNTKDGIHTANMGGTYMSIVYGFGGLRVQEDGLAFSPWLPAQWSGFRFKVAYHGSRVLLDVNRERLTLTLCSGQPVRIHVFGKPYQLTEHLSIPMEKEAQAE